MKLLISGSQSQIEELLMTLGATPTSIELIGRINRSDIEARTGTSILELHELEKVAGFETGALQAMLEEPGVVNADEVVKAIESHVFGGITLDLSAVNVENLLKKLTAANSRGVELILLED